METANEMLEDFLVFLAKEGLIVKGQLPSGAIYFGKTVRSAKDIIDKYWEGFQ